MGNEIKISDLTEKLQALAKKADQDSVDGNRNDKLDSESELSIFRGYVNDAEAKNLLKADDKENLKSIMGYAPVARSIDDVVAKAQGKTNTAVVQDSASAVTTGTRTPMVAFKEYSKTMGPRAAYKKVKEEFEDQKEFKKDVKEVKKYAKEVTRQQNAMRAIDKAEAEFRAKGEYDVSQRKIRARAKEILAEQNGGKIDKWDRGAVNGSNNLISRLTFKNSGMKGYAEGASDALSAEGAVKKTYTFSQLQDKLGKNHPYLQMVDDGHGNQVTLLEKANLIVKKDDETYSIANLSREIKDRVGSDNRLSRQKNTQISELESIKTKIRGFVEGATNQRITMSDSETKRLIHDLCGYGIEHKNYREAIAQGIFGGALAGGAAGLALLMQGKDIVRGTVTNNNKLDVFIKLDQYTSMGNISFGDTNLDSLVASGQATTETVGDVVHINIDQKYAQPFYHEASKHIWKNIGKAAAIGGAIALLEALTHYGKSEDQSIPNLPGICDETKTNSKDEKTQTMFNMENYNEFIEYLRRDTVMGNPENTLLMEAMETLLAYYTDFDKKPPRLAYQNFKDDLNKYAGKTSNLNVTELLRAIKEVQAKSKEELQDPRCEQEVSEEGCYNLQKKVEPKKEPDKAADVATIDHAAKYGWTNLGRLYECFDDMNDKQVWRAMQVIQAIDPDKVGGKYREDQIRDIVRKAFVNEGNGKPDWSYINNELAKEFTFIKLDTLKDVLNATYAGTEVTAADRKIKKGQDGYDKVNIVVAPITLYSADGSEACTRTEDPDRDTRKYNSGDGTSRNKVKVSTHYTKKGQETKVTKYRGKSGDTVTAWYDSEGAADNASKTQFPNKKKCDGIEEVK